MTTIIYDKYNKQLVADTRWSFKFSDKLGKKYLIFVDDCGFDKIADGKNTALLTAGNGKFIAMWRKWWFEGRDKSKIPETGNNNETLINLLIVDKKSNSVIFHAGEKLAHYCVDSNELLGVFAGSGAIPAADCWGENRCGKTAIETSSKRDIHTSQDIKWVDFSSVKTNITDSVYNYFTIKDAIKGRGKIMLISDKFEKAGEISDLNVHSLASAIHNQLDSGEAVASAPVPGLSHFLWTEETTKALHSALDKVAELEG